MKQFAGKMGKILLIVLLVSGCGGLQNVQPPLTEKTVPKTLRSDVWKSAPDYMAAFQKQFEAEVASDVAESKVRVQQVELGMLRDGILCIFLPPWRIYYYSRCPSAF